MLAALLLLPASVLGGAYQDIPAGEFRSMLQYEAGAGLRRVAAFELMREPVTNAEFLAFVRAKPPWRRDRVLPLYAERDQYLAHWQSALTLGAQARPRQPVTRVSWFAARAYCEAQSARLPTWDEWEYVAAADDTRRDAREDPAWSARILDWYAHNSAAPLPEIGRTAPNAYGIRDLHGLVWEWTDDYASMLVVGDNRSQQDSERYKFCGAGALSVADRENYPVMMRVALLSSLRAPDSTSSLGFRCARSLR
jgi:formylglycine-generating enzyme required for sulfatase activity